MVKIYIAFQEPFLLHAGKEVGAEGCTPWVNYSP